MYENNGKISIEKYNYMFQYIRNYFLSKLKQLKQKKI